MQIISYRQYEMSNTVFWAKYEHIVKLSPAEFPKV